ncbi:isoprenoid synthase domain-containing protein [Armillaria fumosa]|nr:isoprenoid synthase domain-containing protein [Armillaria fumosa]
MASSDITHAQFSIQSCPSVIDNPATQFLTGTSSTHWKDEARDILKLFMDHFDTKDLPSVSDPVFHALALKEAERREYPIEELKPYFVLGVKSTVSAYHYLGDMSVKMYATFFHMFMLYLDDLYPRDVNVQEGVNDFTKRFTSSERQPTEILNYFAEFLAETYRIFGKVTADLVVNTALKFLNGLILEVESKNEPTHQVEEYALYLRQLSGFGEDAAIFVFPRELPYNSYIQALPCIRDFINFGNDVLSFYKEECAGETHNLISLLAKARGEPKTVTLRYLAEQCIKAYDRGLYMLAQHEEARKAFEDFGRGYLGYHMGTDRYLLSELNL